MAAPKVVEICCGLGGTRKALTDAGFNVIQSVDFDDDICSFHKHHWGECLHFDITNSDQSPIMDGEVLSAGFPCQPFSTSGYRTGFNHDQGNVFDSLIRLIDNRSFKAVFLENVTGLLSNDAGRTFKIILGTLAQRYKVVEWRTTNLTDQGIPQNRPRLVIVAHSLNGVIFPDVQISAQDDLFTSENKSILELANDIAGAQLPSFGRIEDKILLETTQISDYQQSEFNLTSFVLGDEYIDHVDLKSGRFWGRTGKTTFYTSDKPYSHSVGTSMGAAPTFGMSPDEVSRNVEERVKEVSNWQSQHSGYYVFRLTPREALRLFGPRATIFGDSLESFKSSLAVKYKLIGNMFAPDQAYDSLRFLKDALD